MSNPSPPGIPDARFAQFAPSLPTPTTPATTAATDAQQRADETLERAAAYTSAVQGAAQRGQQLVQALREPPSAASITQAVALAAPSQLTEAASQVAQMTAAGEAIAQAAQQTAAAREAVAQAAQAAQAALAAQAATAHEALAQRFSNVFADAPATSEGSAAGAQPLVEVRYGFRSDGDSDGAWTVQRVRVEEALACTWEAVVELVSNDLGASPDALLGPGATLEIIRGDLTRRVVGMVRRVEDLGVVSGSRAARVVMVPELWRLSQARDARIFQSMTAVDVVREVLRRRGLYDGRVDLELDAEHLVREYVVQYRESDLGFIERLMAEEGITWYFAHTDAGERLVLTDHNGGYEPVATLDGGDVPIAGAEAATLAVESVRFFDWGHELRPTSSTLRDFDWTRPLLDLTAASSGASPDAMPVYEYPAETVITDYNDPSYASDDRDAWARTRQQRHEATARAARVVSNVSGLTPGMTFTLSGHLRSEFDQRYLVVSVQHEGVAPELLHHDTQHARGEAERYRNKALCVPVDVPFRPEARGERPRIHGLQTATVTGPEGEEIFTDEHGRIKVQFHWDREGRHDANTTCWMRVMQPWGGTGWGFVFIPRVGMEVLVSFLEGNPDRPVVLGGAYNGTHRPPYTLPDERTKSTIKTQSSPGGGGYNELRFEDLAGSEEVFIHAQKDFNEVVEHDHNTTVHRHQTNTVDQNHTESVGGDQSLSVTGNRTKTITHDETTTVRGTRTETVTGKETITLHNERVTTIQSGDTLTVNTANHKVEVLSGNDIHNVTGSKTDHVTQHYDVTADRRFKVTQADVSLRFEDIAELLAGPRKISLQNNSATATFDGNKLALTAVTEMSLVCGNASIVLKADGTVTVSGTQKAVLTSTGSSVTAEPAGVSTSGPKITAAATGTHEITGALVKIN